MTADPRQAVASEVRRVDDTVALILEFEDGSKAFGVMQPRDAHRLARALNKAGNDAGAAHARQRKDAAA
jgi:hypothetical protein